MSNMANAKEPKAHTGNPAMLSKVRYKPSITVHQSYMQIPTAFAKETLRQTMFSKWVDGASVCAHYAPKIK